MSTVHDDLFAGELPTTIFPIWPQPVADVVTLGELPAWQLEAMHYPVCAQALGKSKACFLDVFCGMVSFVDIRDAAGYLWPIGGVVYVGDSQVPLEEGDAFAPRVGLLVRVLPPHFRPKRVAVYITPLLSLLGSELRFQAIGNLSLLANLGLVL